MQAVLLGTTCTAGQTVIDVDGMERSCGEESSSWQVMEDLRKRTISARNVGVFHFQEGMGKKDISGCRSEKNKEHKVSGNKNLFSKKFWSKSKEMRIQIAVAKQCAVRTMQRSRAIGKASKVNSGKKESSVNGLLKGFRRLVRRWQWMISAA